MESKPTLEELFKRAQDAVTALRTAQHHGGAIIPGQMLNLKHGMRSEQLMKHPDVSGWHAEQVKEITEDLGGDVELTGIERGMVRETARVEVIVASLGQELLTNGTLTEKGHARQATAVYLSVLDRYIKLASTLGLKRRARRVATLAEVLSHDGE